MGWLESVELCLSLRKARSSWDEDLIKHCRCCLSLVPSRKCDALRSVQVEKGREIE